MKNFNYIQLEEIINLNFHNDILHIPITLLYRLMREHNYTTKDLNSFGFSIRNILKNITYGQFINIINYITRNDFITLINQKNLVIYLINNKIDEDWSIYLNKIKTELNDVEKYKLTFDITVLDDSNKHIKKVCNMYTKYMNGTLLDRYNMIYSSDYDIDFLYNNLNTIIDNYIFCERKLAALRKFNLDFTVANYMQDYRDMGYHMGNCLGTSQMPDEFKFDWSFLFNIGFIFLFVNSSECVWSINEDDEQAVLTEYDTMDILELCTKWIKDIELLKYIYKNHGVFSDPIFYNIINSIFELYKNKMMQDSNYISISQEFINLYYFYTDKISVKLENIIYLSNKNDLPINLNQHILDLPFAT